MDVTRDVIVDLLPLYLAGEASPGTRLLVTDYLSRDPELAEQVRRQRHDEGAVGPAAPSVDLEMQTLRRVRRAIALRHWLFGLAWFFTALSLGIQVTFTSAGVQRIRFLLFDYPQLVGPLVAAAFGCWIAYSVVRRRTALR
jgi:anti-sigma factor RsiW